MSISIPETLKSALSCQQAGRLDRAEGLYQQVLKSDPSQADAWHLLGVIQFQTGRKEAGLQNVCEAIRLKPELAEAHYNHGNMLLDAGKSKEAIDAFNKCVQLRPDNAEAHFNLAHTLSSVGQRGAAVEAYQVAVSLRPDYAKALNNLGQLLCELGRHREAIAVLQQALNIDPKYSSATDNLLGALGKEIESEMAVRPAIMSRLTIFPSTRPAVLVVSHERSGTHFLMNTLAACYEYVSIPHIDLDQHDININYFYPAKIRKALMDIAARPVANTVKSHHAVEFFAGELSRITRRYVVFYIYRNPVSVMLSFWRYVHHWQWNEGPKTSDAVAFARAEPCGRMMRSQMRQYPSLVARWAAHVDGWLAAAKDMPQIVPVRYEDLDTDFETTVRSFADALGQKPRAIVRPDRSGNIIPGGKEDPTGRGVPPDLDALRDACRRAAPDTMNRLSY